jgi:hypothetical protein
LTNVTCEPALTVRVFGLMPLDVIVIVLDVDGEAGVDEDVDEPHEQVTTATKRTAQIRIKSLAAP